MVLEDEGIGSDGRGEEKVHMNISHNKWIYIIALSGDISLSQIIHHKSKPMLMLIQRQVLIRS